MKVRTYVAIDLKSFYASVECVERGLDPLPTHLVAPGRRLTGSPAAAPDLSPHPELAVSYEVAVPRMAHYIEYSTRIYNIYLKYIAPEDIHVYSIDEVMMDVTAYLKTYHMTARELAMTMIREVLRQTGITATAGIGTDLYLCKVAMDIVAKHVEPDADGVRIAELDEMSYRRQLWSHRPLTDFWRVGRGYARKLEQYGLYTMGDIARCSLQNEEALYQMFGVNAELLIDHAWGWEPCTMAQIKAYRPESNSLGAGQVLHCAYPFEKARLVAQEMAEALALDLVDKGLAADQMVLTVGYDIECLTDPAIRRTYKGPVTTDAYGRKVPKHAHGTANLGRHTSSARRITDAVLGLFDAVVDPNLLARRLTITANHVITELQAQKQQAGAVEQLDLFTDYAAREQQRADEEQELDRERRMQQAMLSIKKKFGKNAILKGMDLQEGATAQDRNAQIGGHKA